jgi:hypothetical protein
MTHNPAPRLIFPHRQESGDDGLRSRLRGNDKRSSPLPVNSARVARFANQAFSEFAWRAETSVLGFAGD